MYSLEMAKALMASEKCHLQAVISNQVSNLNDWKNAFSRGDARLDMVDTYQHNKLSFALSLIEFWKVQKIIKAINGFHPDVLYVPFLLTWDFLLYPKLYRRVKIIAMLHDPHPHDESNNVFANWITRQNRNAYKYVNDVVVLNKSDVEYVKENFCPRVHVIPHASFSYYAQQVTEDNRLKNTIGFLGRIEPYKGLDLLVDAFLQLDEKYRMIVAGSGKVDDITLKKIENSGRIELINRYIQDDEFTGLINRMDIVVLPYKRASQSGVIPLVFAHGKTVIATNVGALQEQVPEGTGMIIEPSIPSLVTAINKMYEQPEQITLYGTNAKRYAEKELTWESSADKLLDIIYTDYTDDD